MASTEDGGGGGGVRGAPPADSNLPRGEEVASLAEDHSMEHPAVREVEEPALEIAKPHDDAVDPERYDESYVIQLIDLDQWDQLESYLTEFLKTNSSDENVAMDHVAVILHCRTGHLMKLLKGDRKGAEDYLNTGIKSLEASESRFTNIPKLRRRLGEIVDCVNNHRELSHSKDNLDDVKLAIDHYMKLYLPRRIGYDPAKLNLTSPYYEFTIREGPNSFRCLLCQKQTTMKPYMWLVSHFQGRNPCPDMSEDVRERFSKFKATLSSSPKKLVKAKLRKNTMKKIKASHVMEKAKVILTASQLREIQSNVHKLGSLFYEERSIKTDQKFNDVQTHLLALLGDAEYRIGESVENMSRATVGTIDHQGNGETSASDNDAHDCTRSPLGFPKRDMPSHGDTWMPQGAHLVSGHNAFAFDASGSGQSSHYLEKSGMSSHGGASRLLPDQQFNIHQSAHHSFGGYHNVDMPPQVVYQTQNVDNAYPGSNIPPNLNAPFPDDNFTKYLECQNVSTGYQGQPNINFSGSSYQSNPRGNPEASQYLAQDVMMVNSEVAGSHSYPDQYIMNQVSAAQGMRASLHENEPFADQEVAPGNAGEQMIDEQHHVPTGGSTLRDDPRSRQGWDPWGGA